MAAKLAFVTASLGFVAVASGAFLSAVPEHTLNSGVVAPGFDGIMASLANFDSRGLSDKELQDMETAIEDLVTKGDDVVTQMAVEQMRNFVEQTLIPKREEAQKADQDRLNAQVTELANCHLDKRVEQFETVKNKVSDAEGHQEDYVDHMAKYSSCLDMSSSKELLRDAYCHDVKDAAEVCHCDSKMVKLFGERNTDCESAPKIAAANQKCCNAFFNYEKQNADCAKINAKATYAEKQHEVIMGKLCGQYDACYDSQLKLYTSTVESVKTNEKHRSWEAVYRMKCLFARFKQGKVPDEGVKSCKDQHHDIKGIEYPVVPVKDLCQVEVSAVPA